jgi:hypothetical protein
MMKRNCAGAFGAKSGSGLASQVMMERNDARVVRLRDAGHRFEAQLRELETQFHVKARELSQEFLSTVDELNGEE